MHSVAILLTADGICATIDAGGITNEQEEPGEQEDYRRSVGARGQRETGTDCGRNGPLCVMADSQRSQRMGEGVQACPQDACAILMNPGSKLDRPRKAPVYGRTPAEKRAADQERK